MLFQNFIVGAFRKRMLTRQDNPLGIFYFRPEDFPGLKTHPYTFTAAAGHRLSGYFYHYPSPEPGRLVVFDHGMGNGHRAYFREIETLAKAGFLVFSYDHTGCMESEGEHIGGFAQSLSDLDACITALKAEPALKGRAISVVGHSWGGFSTMNIAAFHPDITHVVSMSGFLSVETILRQELRGLLKFYIPAILDLERSRNPGYADVSALDTLASTNAKVLLIYSSDDKLVHKELSYDPLLAALSGKKNIHFLLEEGKKGHNPSYTTEAVGYKDIFWKELSAAAKAGKLKDPQDQKRFMDFYDFRRMTQQDPLVWDAVIRHLKDANE